MLFTLKNNFKTRNILPRQNDKVLEYVCLYQKKQISKALDPNQIKSRKNMEVQDQICRLAPAMFIKFINK